MHEWLAIIAIAVGTPLLAIADMFRASTWGQASQRRPLWIALSVLLGPLGALMYATGPRLVLRRTVRQLRTEAGNSTTAHA